MISIRHFIVGGFLCCCLACSGESKNDSLVSDSAPPTSGEARASKSADPVDDDWLLSNGDEVPVIRSVRLNPEYPLSRGTIRAQIEFANPHHKISSAHYIWEVAGDRVTGNGPSIVLPELRKGDVVAVRVVADNENGSSMAATTSAVVANLPPRIRALDISIAEDPEEGEVWVANAAGDDPDGDALEFQYAWIVNGTVSTVQQQSFPTRLLKGGDSVRVRVIASDGLNNSNPAESGTVGIANAAPDIFSRPPTLDRAGVFHYAVQARDSDGDTDLSYKLVVGPKGMVMDPRTGLLTWTPQAGQAGEHEIEIAVSDANGGRSTQVFVLPIAIGTADRDTVPARHN